MAEQAGARQVVGAAPGSGFATVQAALLAMAVLYFARELLVPLALAVLLSFVLAPVVRWLRRWHVPRGPAVIVAVLLAVAVILGIGTVMGRQATQLAENLPQYQTTITEKMARLRELPGVLNRVTDVLEQLGSQFRATPATPAAAPQSEEPAPLPVQVRPPEPTAFETLQHIVEPLLGPLATAGIVVILVIFILLYREDLRDRVIRLAGARDLHRTMEAMDDAAYRLSRFFLAQTGLNAGFGLFIAAGLWLIGIPNPLLFGILAGVMRFVPFIGAYVAAAFPALLAVAVDPGWTSLLLVVALFGIFEPLMGQMVEPWVFGQSTGLSPIAVIASATFWTWLWGPIGLLLSVPLTVCLVVLGRHVDRLQFLDVVLSDTPPLQPEDSFYQRALAGDADALAEQAESCLREDKLAQYLDNVALPALRLAQVDAGRGALTAPRLETLRTTVATLLDDLEEEESPPPEVLPPPAWQAPGAILCASGRGPLDALAARMLVQALSRQGYGAALLLGGGPAPPPLLACLAMVPGGASTAAARYQLRRLRRRLPALAVVTLAAGVAGDDTLNASLRAEGPDVRVTTTLRDALEACAEAVRAEAAALPAPVVEPA